VARGRWAVVVLSVVSVALFLVGGLMTCGLVLGTPGGVDGSPKGSTGLAAPQPQPPIHADGLFPQWLSCLAAFTGGVVQLVVFGPGCANGAGGGSAPGGPAYASELVAGQNIMTTLANYLNITAAETANLNATFQELLSYYEARAESVVPYFLNQTWSPVVADEVAIDSGLVPSLIGLETALSHQQYQDWNATAASWDRAFGAGGTYAGDTQVRFETNNSATDTQGFVAYNGQDFDVTQPWEYWTPWFDSPTLGGSNVTYFNLQPNGTIIAANIDNDSGYAAAYVAPTVYDLTTGGSFSVPFVSYEDWSNGNVPVETTLQHIGQFDLLKMVCSTSCYAHDGYALEISNGYAFLNRSAADPSTNDVNTYVPLLNLISPWWPTVVPTRHTEACIALSAGVNQVGPCSTYSVPSEGFSSVVSTGPGATIGGNVSLTGFAQTAQSLVNNSIIMAYDYWVTERAITDNGTYTVPADCVIPPPSDAFSPATNFATYGLSANNVEGVYLAYLNSVAAAYGGVFTQGDTFCGDTHLGFSFNWTSAFTLKLNITASIYDANSTSPLYLNGTPDRSAVYSDAATWPVTSSAPALLYPYDYTLQVPVGTVYAIPANDPISAVLMSQTFPTYNSLSGNGNFVYPSGVLSGTASLYPKDQGGAIYISSCVLNGVSQSTCVISDTYFVNFSVGHVAAIAPPPPPPTGAGSGFNGGICSSLFGWIPLIGGFITAICNFVLGILEIVLIIIVLAVAIWFIAKIAGAYGNRSRGRGDNVS